MDRDSIQSNWFYECPYCGEFLPSHKALRRHVGKVHLYKVDDFMMKYRGGRSIEPVQVKKIVILGAGVAGLRVALNLEKRVNPHLARIIIIDENDYHQYLYRIQKVSNERYKDSEIIVPLSRLLRGKKRTYFVQATVKSIDANRRIVETTDGELSFDILVIALGSKTEYFGIPGLEEHSLILNSFEDAKKIRSRIVERFEGANQPPKIVVGGAGMTGVELAGEIADWYPLLCRAYDLEPSKSVLTMVELTSTIMPGWDEGLIQKCQKKLRELGVEMIFNDGVARASEGEIELQSGTKIEFDLFIWTGGVRGNPVAMSDFETSSRRIVVNEFCRAKGFENIYVAGDCAYTINEEGQPMPPTSHIAMEQAEVVAHNIISSLDGSDMKPYVYSRIGEVVTVGRTWAMADIYGMKLTGLPAKIMKRLVHLWYVYSIGASAFS